MKSTQLSSTESLLAGLQWLFFLFSNIVVIPLTVGAAFQLNQGEIALAVQRSFIFTGLACILQALIGHKLSLMEGQSGLWWGVILNLCSSAASAQLTLAEVGGSLTVGIVCSGIIVMLLGITGLGPRLAKAFTPVVMSVFLFLLASQLIIIFFRGMLGLSQAANSQLNVPVTVLSVVIALLTAIISVKGNDTVSRFAILTSIIVGWIAYRILFPYEAALLNSNGHLLSLYPWGAPAANVGIILTVIITGLINTSNTIGALKGAEPIYGITISNHQYNRSFLLTGFFSIISGFFGMVPYAPYVSSLGFLQSTRILDRMPFIIGSFFFLTLGVIPTLGNLFATLPVSIGDAVLFIAYLQLFGSALHNVRYLHFSHKTIYRLAAPTLLGIAIMNLEPGVFASLPGLVRPLISNGLLIGIALSLIIENGVDWTKHEPSPEPQNA